METQTQSVAEREFWTLPKIPIVIRMIPDPRSAQTRPGSAVFLGQESSPLSGLSVPVLCCLLCEQLDRNGRDLLISFSTHTLSPALLFTKQISKSLYPDTENEVSCFC